jgi:hypothetical protein
MSKTTDRMQEGACPSPIQQPSPRRVALAEALGRDPQAPGLPRFGRRDHDPVAASGKRSGPPAVCSGPGPHGAATRGRHTTRSHGRARNTKPTGGTR